MILRARHVLPMASAPLRDGAVLVRAGRIQAVGPATLLAAENPGEPVRDLGEAALMPGLVNVHAHLELTILRGFADDLPFYAWLRRIVELKRDALRRDEHVFYALQGVAEMLRAGITCVGDCTDTGAPFDALAVAGMRGVVFQEVFGPTREMAEAALPLLEERLDALSAMATDRLAPGISPHSPYLACDRLLDAVAEIAARRALPLSMHVAESRDELDHVATATGPIAEHQAARGYALAPRGVSPVEHLGQRGWLSLPVPLQLVHLVHASREDLQRLADAARSGAKLSVAACPRSNAKLGNGLPDLPALAATGLPWGLGTDGAPAVGSCDLFSEMRAALLLLRGLSADATTASCARILDLATRSGAEALGMGALVGTLEAGKAADLCAVRLDSAAAVGCPDAASAVVQCATPADVALTMVAGEVLYDGQRVVTIDEERVAARCRERAAVAAAALSGTTVAR